MADKIIPKSEVEPIEAVTVSRYESTGEDLSYEVHDQNSSNEDVESEKYGYSVIGKRRYPTMTQGPWVKAGDRELSLYELGFTNPDLYRECYVTIPGIGRIYFTDSEGRLKKINGEVYYKEEDNTDEITPREYEVSIMNVNSYRTTRKTTHVDYQFVEDAVNKYPEYQDTIRERASKSEDLEIP